MAKVFVYRNLTTKLWQYGAKAKSAKANPQAAELILRGVTFQVSQSSHNFTAKKFAQTGKRHRLVHAFACGEIVDTLPTTGTRRQISYNPFKGAFFYDCANGEPVTSCAYVHFTKDQKAFAID